MENSKLFAIPKSFSAAVGLPEKFYLSLCDVLIMFDGLSLVLTALDTTQAIKKTMRAAHSRRKKRPAHVFGVDPLTVASVFRHIAFRTIRFKKCLEFIRPKDVVTGLPHYGVFPCDLSEKSVYRVLRWLSTPYSDYLFRLRIAPNGRRIITPIYGLNIPVFLDAMVVSWRAQLEKRLEGRPLDDGFDDNGHLKEDLADMLPPSMAWVKRGLKIVDHCRSLILPYRPAFKFLEQSTSIIFDTSEFQKKIQRRSPSLRDKADTLREFQDGLQEVKRFRAIQGGLSQAKEG
jgi:hypothetical protein